jgi:hypothetical protein
MFVISMACSIYYYYYKRLSSVRQEVFTHRLGQRQASVLAARVVEVRLVKNTCIPCLYNMTKSAFTTAEAAWLATPPPHLSLGLS